MPFKKGEVSNPKGRPLGATNKRGRIGERLQAILEGHLDNLDADLRLMEPGERVRCITALMQYVIPKYQSVSMANQIELEYKALGVLLQSAQDEAVTAIAGKVLELKAKGGEPCEN